MKKNNDNSTQDPSAHEAALLANLQKQYVVGRDEANQLIGKLQMAQGFQKIAGVVSLSELKNIKENKLYRAMKGQSVTLADGEVIDDVGNWEGFCKAVGTSKSKVDEDLRNISTLGQDAFDLLNKIGLGTRGFRKLRMLTHDQQQQIIEGEIVDNEDLDSLKEKIEELSDKHHKEKSNLKDELKDTTAQLKANREMSKETAVKLQEVQEQLATRKFSTNKWQDEAKDFFESMAKVHAEIEQNMNQLLVLNELVDFAEMDNHAREAATSAWYANNKNMLKRLAHVWNEIFRSHGHLEDKARPSGDWLQEFGFEGAEEVL